MQQQRRTIEQVSEVNILTVTKLRWWPFQLLGFFIARRSLWAAQHLVRQVGLTRQLKRLNFLHAGRWVALGRFPSAGLTRRQRESFWRRWVLFVANFNQGWEPYLFAFLDSFGSGVDTLWGESDGMPDYPLPGTRYDTMEWAAGQLPPSQYFFAAYPEASTNDVRSALRVVRELRAAGFDPATPFEDLPVALRRSLQPCLIPIDPPKERLQHCLGADGHAGFVSCFPLRPGSEVELVRALKASHDDEGNPDDLFWNVPGVHFGRLFVIDREQPTPGATTPLKNSWLVMSVVFDTAIAEVRASGLRGGGVIDRLLRRDPEVPRVPEHVITDFAARLYENVGAGKVSGIWQHCRTGPQFGDVMSLEDFTSMVNDGSVRNLVVYADYPDVTVDRITEALLVHRELLRTATEAGPV